MRKPKASGGIFCHSGFVIPSGFVIRISSFPHMHELSIASGLVEKLLQFTDENPEKKIVEVHLAVGELSHIEEEQLRFCYEARTVATPQKPPTERNARSSRSGLPKQILSPNEEWKNKEIRPSSVLLRS